jgi:SAM-dependent methyltransferase
VASTAYAAAADAPQIGNWGQGYVTTVDYTVGYFGEMNPVRMPGPVLDAGFVAPDISSACELGYGQGVSINIHAAGSPHAWYGTDFNPTHAALAQSVAKQGGSGAQLFDQSFAEFCARPDLPDFDFVGLHGIWSWVSEENRQIIIDFLRRKLRVGGVVYISYNCYPGWAAMIPVRNLLVRHADIMSPPGQGVIPGIQGALAFAEKLLPLAPEFTRAFPLMADWVKQIGGQDTRYVAAEYFNRQWQISSFTELADTLQVAKLSFVTSANFFDRVPTLSLRSDQLSFLNAIPDSTFREAVRDLMVNTRFRQDYWIKGPRRLTAAEKDEAIRRRRVVLLARRADVDLKLTSPLGSIDLTRSVHDPILDLLADHRPRSIGEIGDAMARKNLAFPAVYEALLLLEGKGDIGSAQSEEALATAVPRAQRFNRHVIERARISSEWGFLINPLTGGGFQMTRAYQLFLSARAGGKRTPEEWAQSAWQAISSHGETIVKDGKPLQGAEENLNQLNAWAREFAGKGLPILEAQQVV